MEAEEYLKHLQTLSDFFLHDEEDREEEKGQNREFPGKQENNYLCNNKKHD